MSIYKGPQPLGAILKEVIQSLGIQQKLDEARIIEAWAELAGPQINGVTDSAWVKDTTLFVKITSAVWRQELHMQRGAWCNRLNAHLGAKLVTEIVFR